MVLNFFQEVIGVSFRINVITNLSNIQDIKLCL